MPFLVLDDVLRKLLMKRFVYFARRTARRNPNHCPWAACTRTCSMPQMRSVRSPATYDGTVTSHEIGCAVLHRLSGTATVSALYATWSVSFAR